MSATSIPTASIMDTYTQVYCKERLASFPFWNLAGVTDNHRGTHLMVPIHTSHGYKAATYDYQHYAARGRLTWRQMLHGDANKLARLTGRILRAKILQVLRGLHKQAIAGVLALYGPAGQEMFQGVELTDPEDRTLITCGRGRSLESMFLETEERFIPETIVLHRSRVPTGKMVCDVPVVQAPPAWPKNLACCMAKDVLCWRSMLAGILTAEQDEDRDCMNRDKLLSVDALGCWEYSAPSRWAFWEFES